MQITLNPPLGAESGMQHKTDISCKSTKSPEIPEIPEMVVKGMNPNWKHLCDNPATMRILGIDPDQGENRMSLVTDMTCKENLVRKTLNGGQVMTYPVTVVTDGPMMSGHDIMRVFDVMPDGSMGQLIGYVRIDWNANCVWYGRTWGAISNSVPIEANQSMMSRLRDVLQFLLWMSIGEFSTGVTYADLNVRSAL